MNQRLLTLSESVRYAQCPEMLVDMPGALQRAHRHIARLERACEEHAFLVETTGNRLDGILAAFEKTLQAFKEELDDPENEGETPAPLEELVRDRLRIDIACLRDLFSSLDASELETVEQLAEEF